MNVFKVTYVNNRAISCSLVVGKVIKGNYTYEHGTGNLIHAFIKAHDEKEALDIANDIILKFIITKRSPIQ